MNRRPLYMLTSAMLIATVPFASAQQPPPQPPPMPPSPAALSVPDPLAGFRSGPRDLYQSPDGSDRFQHLSRYPVPPVVFTPGVYFPGPFDYSYGSPYPYPGPYSHDMRAPFPQRRYEAIARGGLVLQTIPDAAQVFVDGYYVGLAEEFGLHGRPMDISAGAHRIELRAPDYETLAFSVSIGPNDIVRYRGDMQPLSPRRAVTAATMPPPQLPAAKSFYVIPNCYAGDKPPSRALPKGCDPKNLQTRK
jgi:hypothetical protein